jgi:hypothetical protein
MCTQAQKAAAARARAARWLINNPERADTSEPSDSEQESLAATQHSPICIDLDSDDDCRYTGGVNVHLDSEQELEDTDGSDKWSDTESLSELEGEELEENLQALRLKLPVTSPEEVTTPYEEIRGGKSAKTFANAEKICGLGYNGLSKHTKQLCDKKARDGAAMHERARNL